MKCQSLLLKSFLDNGVPDASIFEVEEHDVDIQALQDGLAEGDILVQLLVASADPYLRFHVKSTGRFKLNEPIRVYVAGKVLASKSNLYAVGDLFGANLPLTKVQVVSKEVLQSGSHWKLTDYLDEAHISLGVGKLKIRLTSAARH